ncbi:hypothetical protein HA402_009732 [Bradysia odoriphaga]|nr:hypothetical protein HA402_009732 [Bradysia odoriphaga]
MSESESENNSDQNEIESSGEDEASDVDDALDPVKTEEESVSWKDLGLIDTLCEACLELKWKVPSKIQREAIPVALKGNDIIGLAETGSGKTGAFALPILQALLESPQRYFALILTAHTRTGLPNFRTVRGTGYVSCEREETIL